MKLCPYWFQCQPEVARSPCKNGGYWNDARLKNHPVGEECAWHKEIRERETVVKMANP